MDSMIHRLTEEAKKSTMNIKLAAGLFYSKKGFVSIGFNSTRTYLNKKIISNCHAENAALCNYRKRCPRMKTQHLKLIVIRLSPGNNLLLSKPCINCTNSIKEFGIKKIYYMNEQSELVYERIQDLCAYHQKFPFLTRTSLWFQQLQNKSIDVCDKSSKHDQIAIHRKRIGMSQQELAIKMCVDVHTIDQIEKGKSGNACVMQKIQKFLCIF